MKLSLKLKNKFIPASKKSDLLMIVLHGRGDSIKPFYRFNEEIKIPNMNYLLLNAPRKYDSGYSWYGEPPFLKQNLERNRNIILDIINQLISQGWQSEKIFILGFSQGALLSSDIALNFNKPLGGIIGISGYFYFFPRWRQKIRKAQYATPWLMTHGHQDDVLPLNETLFGVKKLNSAGLDIQWYEFNKNHTMTSKDCKLIKNWILDRIFK